MILLLLTLLVNTYALFTFEVDLLGLNCSNALRNFTWRGLSDLDEFPYEIFYEERFEEAIGNDYQMLFYSASSWGDSSYDAHLPHWYNDSEGKGFIVQRSCCGKTCETGQEINVTTDLTGCGYIHSGGVSKYVYDPAFGTRTNGTIYTSCIKMSHYIEPDVPPLDLDVDHTLFEVKKRASDIMSSTYKNNILTMIPTTNYDFETNVVSDTIFSFVCNTTCAYELPNNWTKDKILVYAYKGVELAYRAEYAYQSAQTCHVANCFLCGENFETFNCLSYGNRIAVICTIIFGSVSLLILLFIGSAVCLNCYRFTPVQVLVLCLIGMIAGAAACDSNLILSGDQVDCIVTGADEICQIKTQSLITLPALGSKLCLTVLNEDSNLLMGYVNITYEQGLAIAGLQLEYWTSNRKTAAVTAKYCPGNALCSAKINCETERTEQEKWNMGGALYGMPTILPGKSFCSDACGCAGCNCILCNEACAYSRWAIAPVPSLWRVLAVASSRLVPRIRTCYGDSAGAVNCSSSDFHAGTQRDIGGNFSMTYIGSFQASFNFLGRKLLVDEAKVRAFFVEAAQKNIPIAGMPGEIQGNSPLSFTNVTPTSFMIATDICSSYISDSFVHYDCVTAPLNGAVTGLELPAMVDGIYWLYSSDDTLVGDVQNPPGASFSMIGTGSLKFQTRRTQVCPKLEFIEIYGVWGSPLGATGVLRGVSSCLPGKCILSTHSTQIQLDSVYLDLDIEEQDLQFFFRSNVKQVNFELLCTSIGTTTVVVIEGELEDPVPITPITPPSPPDGFNKWFDDLSLGGKIGFSIGMSIIGLLIIGLLILLALKTPEIVHWIMMRHYKAKMIHHEDEEIELSSDTVSEPSTLKEEPKPNDRPVKESAQEKALRAFMEMSRKKNTF